MAHDSKSCRLVNSVPRGFESLSLRQRQANTSRALGGFPLPSSVGNQLWIKVYSSSGYEGIDASQAVYEWDYSRQLLHLRAAEVTGGVRTADSDQLEDELTRQNLEAAGFDCLVAGNGDAPPGTTTPFASTAPSTGRPRSD